MKKGKRRFLIIFLIALLAIIVVSSLLSNKKKAPSYSSVQATIGNLVQTVSETGTVKPVKEVSLNFLASGRVENIAVKVGDRVLSKQLLATLDDNSLQSKKIEAEANLSMAQASLSKLLAGASGEAVAVSLSSLNQAKTAAASAQTNLDKVRRTVAENISQATRTLSDLQDGGSQTITPQEQAVASAQTNLDNAKKTGQKNIDNSRNSAIMTLSDKILLAEIALDKVKTMLEDDDAEKVLGVKDSGSLDKAKTARESALALLPATEKAVADAKAGSDEESVTNAGVKVKSLLQATDQALDLSYALLEATIVSSAFSQTDLDSYKSMISTQSNAINAASLAVESATQTLHNAILSYQTSVAAATDALSQAQTALSNALLAAGNNLSSVRLSGDQAIASAQASLDSAKQAVAVAQAQYNNTIAGPRNQDIALAQAQVSQAQAGLDGINQQISETQLLAPLDGVVTAVNYEVGEQFTASKPIISILVNNSFNIEVDIAESDISKVKIGNPVDITFDAFPEEFVLKGKVGFIEPAQTVIQDVVYYKVKIDFADQNESSLLLSQANLTLKSGMTANVDIQTASRENVVQVPGRALIDKDGNKIVRLVENGEIREVPVSVGLSGDEGMTEIISGLKAGDTVITFMKAQ